MNIKNDRLQKHRDAAADSLQVALKCKKYNKVVLILIGCSILLSWVTEVWTIALASVVAGGGVYYYLLKKIASAQMDALDHVYRSQGMSESLVKAKREKLEAEIELNGAISNLDSATSALRRATTYEETNKAQAGIVSAQAAIERAKLRLQQATDSESNAAIREKALEEEQIQEKGREREQKEQESDKKSFTECAYCRKVIPSSTGVCDHCGASQGMNSNIKIESKLVEVSSPPNLSTSATADHEIDTSQAQPKIANLSGRPYSKRPRNVLFLIAGGILLIAISLLAYRYGIGYIGQSKAQRGVYGLFDPRNIGMQILALEKKFDVTPFLIDSSEGKFYRAYEGDKCDVSVVSDSNGKIVELSTFCNDVFKDIFKAPESYDRHVVSCLNCGNSADPKYILRVGESRAFPVVTEYSLNLEYNSISEWKGLIAKAEGVGESFITDEMINCSLKYEESARRLWKIESVNVVTYKSSSVIEMSSCNQRSHSVGGLPAQTESASPEVAAVPSQAPSFAAAGSPSQTVAVASHAPSISLPKVAEMDTSPFAPSFDCAKVSSGAERLICGDRELSKMDVEMVALYGKKRESTADHMQLKDEQLEWMKYKRNACSDKPCMVAAYKERIAVLSGAAQTTSLKPTSQQQQGSKEPTPEDMMKAFGSMVKELQKQQRQ